VRLALLVALGGAAGSLARWGLASAIQRWSGVTFPWGTLAVNAAGALAIGFVGALALERAQIPPALRHLLIAGVLGGFTTFSAYSWETLALLREGQWVAATLYAGGSVIACLAAVALGFAAGMRV
jgi:CrcB protein